jgi:hypothetical protein
MGCRVWGLFTNPLRQFAFKIRPYDRSKLAPGERAESVYPIREDLGVKSEVLRFDSVSIL